MFSFSFCDLFLLFVFSFSRDLLGSPGKLIPNPPFSNVSPAPIADRTRRLEAESGRLGPLGLPALCVIQRLTGIQLHQGLAARSVGRSGWVGLGWVGLGWVGLGWAGLAWLGLAWLGLLACWLAGWLLGLAWLGLAWLGLAWLGLAWLGLAWLGLAGWLVGWLVGWYPGLNRLFGPLGGQSWTDLSTEPGPRIDGAGSNNPPPKEPDGVP